MRPVVRTDQAEADLAGILDYLDERNPFAAERLAAEIDERCTLLAEFPEVGRTREEISPGLRSILVQRYVLFYRVTPVGVEVLRILHGARDLEGLLGGEEWSP